MTSTQRNRQRPFLVALAVVLAGCADSSRIAARVETINGQQVELATAGSGDGPTVVFEAGLGEDWTHWDRVASEVAKRTRVFAYSREGFGASGPLTSSRDPKVIVEELRALLTAEGYAPPYVLVGHSMGGTYMELFAKEHPEEVTGVVLVDPRHRDFLTACEAANLDGCGIPEALLAIQAPSVAAEYHAFPLISDEIRAAGPFGAYPVRVLTATVHAWSPPNEAMWESMLGSLAAEAVDGKQIIVRGAGHHIQLDRPDVVVDTIEAMLPSEGVTP